LPNATKYTTELNKNIPQSKPEKKALGLRSELQAWNWLVVR